MTPQRFVSAKEVEAGLRRLRGVVAVRIAYDTNGGVSAVHAVAEPGRPAKMVVRDIESCLLAQWGLTLLRNKISVASLAPGQAPPVRPRLRVASCGVVPEDGTWAARVTLERGDEGQAVGTSTVIGGGDGALAAADRARLVSEATLRAVENAAGAAAGGRLRLLDLSVVPMDGRRVITLLVALAGNKGDDLLTGSALVRGDGTGDDATSGPDRAVVAATLDAVNRRLAALDPGNGTARPSDP